MYVLTCFNGSISVQIWRRFDVSVSGSTAQFVYACVEYAVSNSYLIIYLWLYYPLQVGISCV
uniref:Uncharacterized protein n=1 Tax=Oryza brachyantha TaxID=4533 RepID=J3M253_ORYBR